MTSSATRRVDKKVANLLLKVAQKVATLKNQFRTDFNRFLKVRFLDFVLQLVPQLLTGFGIILISSPKSSQIAKSPKQNIVCQIVQKVAQLVKNRQIWQH